MTDVTPETHSFIEGCDRRQEILRLVRKEGREPNEAERCELELLPTKGSEKKAVAVATVEDATVAVATVEPPEPPKPALPEADEGEIPEKKLAIALIRRVESGGEPMTDEEFEAVDALPLGPRLHERLEALKPREHVSVKSSAVLCPPGQTGATYECIRENDPKLYVAFQDSIRTWVRRKWENGDIIRVDGFEGLPEHLADAGDWEKYRPHPGGGSVMWREHSGDSFNSIALDVGGKFVSTCRNLARDHGYRDFELGVPESGIGRLYGHIVTKPPPPGSPFGAESTSQLDPEPPKNLLRCEAETLEASHFVKPFIVVISLEHSIDREAQDGLEAEIRTLQRKMEEVEKDPHHSIVGNGKAVGDARAAVTRATLKRKHLSERRDFLKAYCEEHRDILKPPLPLETKNAS